jgi:hypothetical protein
LFEEGEVLCYAVMGWYSIPPSADVFGVADLLSDTLVVRGLQG